MWSSISPVHWKSLKSSLKTYHDVPNNILKEIIFFQKSYGNTTRLKILNTIKKKSVPFQAISGDLLLGQTRAQSQLVGMCPTFFLATIFFSIFVSFFTTIFLPPLFFLFFLRFFFLLPPLFFFNLFVFLAPCLYSFGRVICG